MIPPHLFYQIYISFFSKMIALYQNVTNCQNIHGSPQDINGSDDMTDEGTTQYNFILSVSFFKKTHFRMTSLIEGCSSFIWCKAWRQESESVNIIRLNATEYLISSRALMITQISAVNMDAESGNLMGIMVLH